MHAILINTMANDKIFSREFFLVSSWAFLISNNFYTLLTVIPLYALRILNLSEAEAGLATGLFVAGMLASRFAAGKLTEKLGFFIMLLCGIIALIVFTLLYMLAETPFLLYILRILNGIFYGFTSNTIITVVSTIIPAARSGEGIGYFSMFQMTAWAVGPYVGVMFANSGNYDAIFLYTAITPAIALASLPFFRMRVIREKTASINVVIDDTQIPRDTKSAYFIDKFLERSVLPIAILGFIMIMFNSSVVSFVTPYAEVLGLTKEATYYFLFYVIAMIATRPFVSRLFDKKGSNVILIPGVVIYVFAYIVLAFVGGGVSLLISAALIGMGLGAVQNTLLALNIKTAKRERLGFANATFYAFLDLCTSIGPVVTGLLIPILDYRGTFIVAAIWTAIGLPVYGIMVKHRKIRIN